MRDLATAPSACVCVLDGFNRDFNIAVRHNERVDPFTVYFLDSGDLGACGDKFDTPLGGRFDGDFNQRAAPIGCVHARNKMLGTLDYGIRKFIRLAAVAITLALLLAAARAGEKGCGEYRSGNGIGDLLKSVFVIAGEKFRFAKQVGEGHHHRVGFIHIFGGGVIPFQQDVCGIFDLYRAIGG